MRRLSILTLLAVVVGIAVPFLAAPATSASAGDDYAGAYFGEHNFPPGCTRDRSADNPDNVCYRMKQGLNGLDSPQVDVLVMVPVSPTAERDMRIMRQSIEMWEGGIQSLAGQMGLGWLEQGVDFHVTVDYVDLAGEGGGGEFTTYPIVDPEIVVIATNPVGGVGIGIDPVDFLEEVGFTDEDQAPCHGIANPFDFEAWSNVPGFESHHEARSGTYVDDCGPSGGGGNICFAVNGAIDPDPTSVEIFGLFDLVSHEVGHCLTLGHVGDGGETIIGQGWGPVPTNDIMSYDADPVGLTKCVSTLDVEAFAVTMSRYVDVNGDGTVDGSDTLLANDQVGDGLFPFQVQRPEDHQYASATGAPTDCPQPDTGLVPGERTDWTPAPVTTSEPTLVVSSPTDGTTTGQDGSVVVEGTVEHRHLEGAWTAPSTAPATGAPAETSASEDKTQTITYSGAFEIEQSSFGVTHQVEPLDSSHTYALDLTRADVTATLAWSEDFGPSDLDLRVTGDADSGESGVTANHPEQVTLPDVGGHLDLRVTPVSIGVLTNYTLTITVTPLDGGYGGLPAPDADLDEVPDTADACPIHPGTGTDGCAERTLTTVRVVVDGAVAGTAGVDADYGAAAFSIPVTVPEGDHDLVVEWVGKDDSVLATRTLVVHRPVTPPPPPDTDGDGIPDTNDDDIDGDGFKNRTEERVGTDPYDPASRPRNGR